MKWWYWLILSTVLSSLLFLTIRFGMGPKPVRLMGPTEFEKSEQIGAVLYRRLFADLKKAPLVVFGVDPVQVNHREIPNGFLKTAQAEGLTFDHIIVDSTLGFNPFSNGQVLDLQRNTKALLSLLEQANLKKHRVLLLTLNNYSSTIPEKSMTQYILEKMKLNTLSFSVFNFALKHDQEELISPSCETQGATASGSGRIGCFLLKKSRSIYRKKHYEKKGIVAAADQVAKGDFLIYISLPKN